MGLHRGRGGLTAARPRYWISILPQRVPFGATGQPSAAQARYTPLSFAISRNWLVEWFTHAPGSEAQRVSPKYQVGPQRPFSSALPVTR